VSPNLWESDQQAKSTVDMPRQISMYGKWETWKMSALVNLENVGTGYEIKQN
jgi:hypothetical protein